MENTTSLNKPKTRLYFIDMARTIAILLMLEGHFVHDSLAPIYASDSYPAYVTWKFIRGFTSPTFLTVTGLIFTYLLL
ncbi:MAG: heparan-alpha-glucosaminide N-acetyltransferase domain-containing protein, partial [Sphingomonadales bacterium]